MNIMDICLMLKELTPVSMLFRLVLAAVLGALIGLEQDKSEMVASMRTYLFVCVGAAMSTLIGIYVCRALDYSIDPLRIGAQVITGIGFLGAGTILVKNNVYVAGRTAAASLWVSAPVGLAAGIGYYEAAVCATLIVILANFICPLAEKKLKKKERILIYIELNDITNLNAFFSTLSEKYEFHILHITPAYSGIKKHTGIEVETVIGREQHADDILRWLLTFEPVVYTYELRA